jgi:hypothetical protein
MNKEENRFDDFLRERLDQHTVEVSPSVWEKINAQQKKRQKLMWFRNYLNIFLAFDVMLITTIISILVIHSSAVLSEDHVAAFKRNKNSLSQTQDIENNNHIAFGSGERNKTKSVPKEREKHETVDANPNTMPIGNNEPESSKTIGTIAIAQSQGEARPSKSIFRKNKKNENKLSTAGEVQLEKQVLHSRQRSIEKNHTSQTAQPNDLPQNFNYPNEMMPLLAMHPSSAPSLINCNINEQQAAVAEITPSVMFSKPKKLARRDEKIRELAAQNLAAKQAENNEQPSLINTQGINASVNEIKPLQVEPTALKGQESPAVPAAQSPLASGNMEKSEDIIQLDTVYGGKRFKGYIALDALIAPELAGSSFSGNNNMVSNYISRRDSAEKISFSYSAMMRVNLFVSRNIFINTGIQFSQRREKFSIGYKWQTNEPYIDSSEFVTYIDPFTGPVIYKTYDTLNYVRTFKDSMQHNLLMSWVDIPVMMGYKWLGRRAALSLQAGVMFNLLFSQKGNVAPLQYVPGDVQQTSETLFNHTAGISFCGGVSVSRRLTDKLDLLIEPHTRYVLKPITTEAFPIQQKVFTYGINIGVRYKL